VQAGTYRHLTVIAGDLGSIPSAVTHSGGQRGLGAALVSGARIE